MSKNQMPAASTAPQKPVQESRSRAYRAAYHRAHYGTVSACLPRPEKEAFREACRAEGKTQHEVLAELVAEWMTERETFNYQPVMFI